MDILYFATPRAACFNYFQDSVVCTCEVILLLQNIWKLNFLVKNFGWYGRSCSSKNPQLGPQARLRINMLLNHIKRRHKISKMY